MNKAGNSGENTASKSSEKTYTLNSSKPNWNFKSEIPKTAVKNSEGTYTLGRNNEWNFDTKYNIRILKLETKVKDWFLFQVIML